ncbi:MAG: DnaJ domain-containing protein [Akkermansiaceae bacterium]|nr:DnaJ domain-containing protein [Akkermansiaceae bacterium]MCP5543929.1 DnaJ domain-containing protein [Akkermansiaceae bacterium]MCP5547561.1 DnaJ domain-containing protein [Akkermansiaceae bacterium]
MRSAFDTLGIPQGLVVDESALAAAFREAGAKVHPDAGGAEEDFAELRRAMDVLSSPSKRLRHWLELRGIEVDPRGTVDDRLMDLFSEVGAVTGQAEVLVRKRAETRSALALAMLEGDTQVCRESVEAASAKVDQAIGRETALFPAFETAADIDVSEASRVVRNLAFLEKWKSSLRGLYARLV